LTGYCLEDLSLGQSAERAHVVSEADITAFAALSGDFNPVHMDETFAAATPFKGRIAHGMLSAAYISALIAGELPGPGAIYLSQSLRFRRPVRIGDEVSTRVTISAIDERRARVTLRTACSVGGAVVLDGEALVLAPKRGG
jgi:3-hydroxybutyryl-CoA dehydratase